MDIARDTLADRNRDIRLVHWRREVALFGERLEICVFFCGSIWPALLLALRFAGLVLLFALLVALVLLLLAVLLVALVLPLGVDALSCLCIEDFGASAVEGFAD